MNLEFKVRMKLSRSWSEHACSRVAAIVPATVHEAPQESAEAVSFD